MSETGGTSLRDERGFNQGFALVGSTVERMQRRNHWFVDRIAEVGAKRVLELGCGTGETADYIAAHSSAEVVAVDISEAFIGAARQRFQRANLRYETLDLLGPAPREFGSFDMVCGNGILHHLVARLPEILASLRGISNPGGMLAFIEPNFANPYCAFIFGTAIGRRWANLEPDEMAFMAGELRRALAASGWHTVEVATRDFVVPGLPEALVGPIISMEPVLEATALTRWLAQSHFFTARA